MKARALLKAAAPPLLWDAARWIRDRAGTAEWEYSTDGWVERRGWDAEAVADAYAEKWASFLAAVEGPEPLGVVHEVPAGQAVTRTHFAAHNVVMSFAYVLALAARSTDRVSVLDWGGGTGHYAVLARALLPAEVELDYHIRETPAVVAQGRRLLPEVTFCADESYLERRYDLVLASSAVQYAQDWRGTSERLVSVCGRYLYLARVPVAIDHRSFVVIQRAHAYGYETEYPGWVINKAELCEHVASCGMSLVREFLMRGPLRVRGAPEAIQYRGYCFRPLAA